MIVLKRTLEMKVRFTKTELDALTKKARKSGLSREGYCRRVLNGTEVKEAPPADVPVLILWITNWRWMRSPKPSSLRNTKNTTGSITHRSRIIGGTTKL